MRLLAVLALVGCALVAHPISSASQSRDTTAAGAPKVSSDTTARRVICEPHIMVSKRDRFWVQLADSSMLLIDKRTPGGFYILLDGRTLDLVMTRRYPRPYSICTRYK